jgi:hypothetical protein
VDLDSTPQYVKKKKNYDERNNNREEGQTPKYIGKVPYIQNQQGKLTYE